jgi:hypothetical protein
MPWNSNFTFRGALLLNFEFGLQEFGRIRPAAGPGYPLQSFG